MDIDLDKPLEPQIRREIVAAMLKKLDLNLSEERRKRVEDDMREHMDAGVPAAHALSFAIDFELKMYGDPHALNALVGIFGAVK